MTREETQEYAKTMTFSDAINNLMQAKSIPYRKATFIKITELLKALEQEPKTGHWIEERTYMECPNCHDIWHYEENQTERFKFCPTCGERIK